MSKRQPTIIVNDIVIAHDEIAEIIELNESRGAAGGQTESMAKAVRLVSGAIIPVSAQKLERVLDFLYRNEH